MIQNVAFPPLLIINCGTGNTSPPSSVTFGLVENAVNELYGSGATFGSGPQERTGAAEAPPTMPVTVTRPPPSARENVGETLSMKGSTCDERKREVSNKHRRYETLWKTNRGIMAANMPRVTTPTRANTITHKEEYSKHRRASSHL